MNTAEITHLEIVLAKMVVKQSRALSKMKEYENKYQSLRDTFTVEEDKAHRCYCIWQTKAQAADYGVWQIKDTIRCLKAGLITR